MTMQIVRGASIRRGTTAFAVALATTALSGPLLAAEYDPQGVSFRIEGCRNPSVDLELTNFICADGDYTTGNLGKTWNELDLVPHRVTTSAGNSAPASQTFKIAVVADHEEVGHPGYDVISEPTLDVAMSDASCEATVGPEIVLNPGFGGTEQSLYRMLTITQDKNTDCVFNYYERLAVGSHQFPGASLHSNLANQFLATGGIGNKDVSIPVNEILPQELAKDMAATQDVDYIWNLTKAPTPATLDFGDSCADGAPSDAQVTIRIEWQKIPAAPGEINVITNIYGTNPAHRVITIDVTDNIYSAGDVLQDTATSGEVDIPANTEMLLFTHLTTVPAGTVGLYDVATATYIDKFSGVPVPGVTEATASAEVTEGDVLNGTATIADIEWIDGDGLSFSVDAVSGAGGSFENGYTLGTIVGPGTAVEWISVTQSDDGYAEFDKTVYLAGPAITSGALSDVATLVGSDGFETTADAAINISSNATVELDINKSVPPVLSGSETASFTFDISGPGGYANSVVIDFVAGETTKGDTLSGLAPGLYTVSEQQVAPWMAQPPQSADLGLPVCGGSVDFTNTFSRSTTRAIKSTYPAGNEGGWSVTLTGPGGSETQVTDSNGEAYFNMEIVEGSYTLTEELQAGWAQTAIQGCSFTVDYPADAGTLFECAFENTKLGRITVIKETDPDGAPDSFTFTTDYGSGGFSLTDGQSNTSGLLMPGNYSVSETLPAGWQLTSASCDDGSDPSSIDLEAGEEVTCTFNNQKKGKIIVRKLTTPSDSGETFDFAASYDGDGFTLGHGGEDDSGYLDPGTYSVSETVPEGWELDSATCDDGSDPARIDLGAGETVTCTFENLQLSRIIVMKETIPAGSAESFEFVTSYSAGFSLIDGGSDDSGNLRPGIYSVDEVPEAGWELLSATCSDDSDPAAIDLAAGETVTCTFVNRQYGKIIVEKTTDPAGAPDSFEFAPSWAANFTLQHGGSADSGDLVTGSYSVSEVNLPAGWDLDSATCDDGSDPSSIGLAAGEIVTCTFHNKKRGKIIVEKQTLPDGATQTFEFSPSWGSAFTLGDGEQSDSGWLVAGSYDVSETVPEGWEQLSATCDDGSDQSKIELATGEVITCVFTNRQYGKIIVEKVTRPTGASQSFDFTTSYDGSGFSLTDGQSDDSGFLRPGTYSAAEVNIPEGWDLESATCDDGSAPGSIDLGAGETVTCTFTNVKRGKIIVTKQTEPDGSQQSFTFNASYGGFALTDGQSDDSGWLQAGTYSVSETLPAGWQLVSATCDDGSDPGSIGLGEGEIVNCTFTNRQDGRIIVKKTTDPVTATDLFGFTTSYGAGFSLGNGGENNSGDLTPGTYSVAETDPGAEWDLISATCDDGSPIGAIALGAGETVTCTFHNRQRGHIIVEKQTAPDGSAQLFDFTASYGAFALADGQQNDSGPLAAGTYSVGETVPAGWDLMSASCDDGSPISAISLQAGETVRCLFLNQQRGKIIIEKQTLPDGSLETFDFTGDLGPFTLGDGEQHDSGLIMAGVYAVAESVPYGWDLTDATCDDGSPVGAIDLAPAEIVTCVFTNTERADVDLIKTFSGVVDPSKDINFTLTGPELGAGVTLSTLNVIDGVLDFGVANLLPGETYTMCENPVPVGWSYTWMLDSVSVEPYNPDAGGQNPEDLGVRCYDFSLEPGQSSSFEVDNIAPPGGGTRTIGYWKNWNYCSGGNQWRTAERNGGVAEGFYLLEDILPQFLGELEVATCEVGATLLNKEDLRGKKRASDAAYSMAAQLLAAQANFAAGAATCAAAAQAVTEANALLTSIGFDGRGAYLSPKNKPAGAIRNQANELAGILDEYNNGLLCN